MFADKTILLVDDHEKFLATVAEALRAWDRNLYVLTAENGDRALKVLESTHVDLVVTDLRMPVMNGFDLLSHLKKRDPNIPVFVLSSFLEPEVETRLKTLGVSQSIKKESFNVSALGEMILKSW